MKKPTKEEYIRQLVASGAAVDDIPDLLRLSGYGRDKVAKVTIFRDGKKTESFVLYGEDVVVVDVPTDLTMKGFNGREHRLHTDARVEVVTY